MEVCPTDVVRATPARVWALLTDSSLFQWVDGKLIEAPPRLAAVGDCARFSAGLGFGFSWTVLGIEPSRQLALDVVLPFGMGNRITIVISPIDDERCRVTFN